MPENEEPAPNSDESSLVKRIPIIELADELQCHKQTLFKIAKRLEIKPVERRDSDRGNQLVGTVTPTEARRIEDELQINRKTGEGADTDAEPLAAEWGVFYLLQLEPDYDPGRVKVGFTNDLEGRIRKHRCSAPFTRCMRSWPCRRTWERAAIDSVTAGLEQLHTEVFRTDSVDKVANRGDRFFSVMPGSRPASANNSKDTAQ